jgi:hypothetical protein
MSQIFGDLTRDLELFKTSDFWDKVYREMAVAKNKIPRKKSRLNRRTFRHHNFPKITFRHCFILNGIRDNFE